MKEGNEILIRIDEREAELLDRIASDQDGLARLRAARDALRGEVISTKDQLRTVLREALDRGPRRPTQILMAIRNRGMTLSRHSLLQYLSEMVRDGDTVRRIRYGVYGLADGQ